MAMEDYFDPYGEDEQPTEVRCKFCGEAGLYWEENATGWFLVDEDGEEHVCEIKATSEFEDLDK